MNAISQFTAPAVQVVARPMPCSVEAEQALLGACLINGDAIDIAAATIKADDFHDPVHGKIWSSILAMREAGKAVTVTLLQAAFGAESGVELAPGQTLGKYFAALLTEATTVMGVKDYASTVRHLADCRRVIAAADDAKNAAYEGMLVKPSEIASGAIASLDAIITAGNSTHLKAIGLGEAADMAFDRCELIADHKLKPVDISWGVRALNQQTVGLEAGDLIIIGGRPSMGKTTFGEAVALEAAKLGQPTLFFSLEMTGQQIGQRALAWRSYGRTHPAITYQDIRAGKVTSEQRDVLRAAKDDIAKLPIIVEQEAGLTIGQIGVRARRHKQAFERDGKKLRLIVVDHLGIIKASERYKGQRVNEVAEFTAALKVLAKELEVAVIALCQLSRATEGRDDKRPTLGDFRDSGAIEQDADIVIGVYREDYYLSKKTTLTPEEIDIQIRVQNTMEAIFLKQRQGPTGTVRLFASMPCNYISDLQQ